jgi:hypothetical protein
VFSGGTTPVDTAWTPGLHPDRLEMSSSDRPDETLERQPPGDGGRRALDLGGS